MRIWVSVTVALGVERVSALRSQLTRVPSAGRLPSGAGENRLRPQVGPGVAGPRRIAGRPARWSGARSWRVLSGQPSSAVWADAIHDRVVQLHVGGLEVHAVAPVTKDA